MMLITADSRCGMWQQLIIHWQLNNSIMEEPWLAGGLLWDWFPPLQIWMIDKMTIGVLCSWCLDLENCISISFLFSILYSHPLHHHGHFSIVWSSFKCNHCCQDCQIHDCQEHPEADITSTYHHHCPHQKSSPQFLALPHSSCQSIIDNSPSMMAIHDDAGTHST